jgi:hypothetical protein
MWARFSVSVCFVAVEIRKMAGGIDRQAIKRMTPLWSTSGMAAVVVSD